MTHSYQNQRVFPQRARNVSAAFPTGRPPSDRVGSQGRGYGLRVIFSAPATKSRPFDRNQDGSSYATADFAFPAFADCVGSFAQHRLPCLPDRDQRPFLLHQLSLKQGETEREQHACCEQNCAWRIHVDRESRSITASTGSVTVGAIQKRSSLKNRYSKAKARPIYFNVGIRSSMSALHGKTPSAPRFF